MYGGDLWRAAPERLHGSVVVPTPVAAIMGAATDVTRHVRAVVHVERGPVHVAPVIAPSLGMHGKQDVAIANASPKNVVGRSTVATTSSLRMMDIHTMQRIKSTSVPMDV